MGLHRFTDLIYFFVTQSRPTNLTWQQQLLGAWPVVAMVLVIYFLLIRPANRRRQELESFRNQLKKDDEVFTSSGMYGRIIALDTDVATLAVADKVKIKVLRHHIAGRWAERARGANEA